MKRLILLLAILAGTVGQAACSRAPENQAPANLAIVANAPGTLGVGHQRLVFGLVAEDDNRSLASPELGVQVGFYRDDPVNEVGAVDAQFRWTVPDVRGVYVAHFAFDQPGNWGATLRPEGLPPTHPAPFSVVADPIGPQVGEPAPPSDTPTADDAPLTEISSDPDPDPRFYELSLTEAFASGRPTVVVFATPAFCQSATCGPTLDIVKGVAAGFPEVNFVHVEVYTNLDATSFDELELAPAVAEWSLPSEPWVFVVDSQGRVAARFEGTISPQELEESIRAAAGP